MKSLIKLWMMSVLAIAADAQAQDVMTLCQSQNDFKEFATRTIQACAGNPDRIESVLNEITIQAADSSNCTCFEYAIALGIQLKLFGESHVATFQSQCEVTDANLAFALGTMAYDKKEYQNALEFFNNAFDNGVEPSICQFNMAACYLGLHERVKALACLEVGSKHLPDHPVSQIPQILTLQATYLELEEWDLVLKWTHQFEELFAESVRNAEPDWITRTSAFKTYNQLNEILAYTGLNDTAFIRSHWTDVDWDKPELIDFRTLLCIRSIAPYLESSLMIRETENTIDAAFRTMDPEHNRQELLGTFSLLHPSIRDSLFNQAKAHEIWIWLNQLENDVFGEMRKAPTLKKSATLFKEEFNLLSSIALVISFALCFFLFSRWLIIRRLEKLQLIEHFQVIERYLLQGKGSKSSALSSLNAIYSTSQSAVANFMQEKGIDLSTNEQLLLASFQLKLSPKEIAQKHSWSPGYVYNMTSALRAKLQLSPSETLQDWVNENLSGK